MPPAKLIMTILADYMRVSMDIHPYQFYANTKTAGFAVTNFADAPLSTIRLNAADGNKFYKKHTFNVMVLESQFLNLYQGLFLMPKGHPITPPFASRDESVPELNVTQAIRRGYKAEMVTTPPPHMIVNETVVEVPMPKGEDNLLIVCLKDLEELEVMKLKNDTYDDKNGTINYIC